MKSIIIFTLSTIFSLVSCNSVTFYAVTPNLHAIYPYSYGLHSSSLVTPSQQQYHTQDDLGQYAYGYSEPLSTKQEVRSLDGITRGSYSYRDAEGKLQTVDYTADADGFRVVATNLPRSVQTSPQLQSPIPTASVFTQLGNGATTPAALLQSYKANKLHLAKHNTASISSSTMDAARPVGQLHQPVEKFVTTDFATTRTTANTAEDIKATGTRATTSNINQLKELNHDLETVNRKYPAVIYTIKSDAFKSLLTPKLYTYGYPLNSRFLASDVYHKG